jgi:hypothetical protein
MQKLICTALLFASFVLSGTAQATPLTGNTVSITSVYNGGAAQTVNVLVGSPTEFGDTPEVTPSTFSWMISGDFIDLHTNSNPNAPETLTVYFSSAHSFGAGADTIEITLNLPANLVFGPIALTTAIDVQIPEAYVSGGTLYFKIDHLDQIGDGDQFFGQATYKFGIVEVPTPAPLALLGLGLTLMGFVRRRT